MLNSAVGASHHPGLSQGCDPWYPLAPLQAGMLYDALRLGRHSGYDIEQVHLVLEERTDPASLARAFEWLTRRHTALHTEFRWDQSGAPQQRSASHFALPVEIENVVRVAESDRPALVAQILDADRRLGFDVHRPPLGRLRILVMDPEHTEVIWTLHHILIDALSLPVALLEAFETYEAFCCGKEPTCRTQPPRFRSYVDGLASLDLEASRAYFGELLANGSTPPTLPGLNTTVSNGQAKPDIVRRETGPETLRLARALAARTNTTVETVIHAAWALVLSRHCSCNDNIVFGSTRACRRKTLVADIDNMVGLLANTLPLSARFDDAATVSSFLQGLRAQAIGLKDHEHMPLYKIEHQGAGTNGALINTTVTFQRWDLTSELRRRGGPKWNNRLCTLHEQPVPPLNVRVVESEQLEISLLFDSAQLARGAIERVSDSFVHTLGALAEDEHRKLDEVSVLPAYTVQQVIYDWNQTAFPVPEDLLIHELFEARVEERPEATAVECNGRQLTYGELEMASNRVAHALRSQGVEPGHFVAICLSRGLDLVIALLGVAKSGASYVPLDPRYPEARLAFMVHDSAARCVLTEPAHFGLLEGSVRLNIGEITARHELPTTRPARSASSTNICYAIYTSGTTGEPNGVLLSHRAVINTLDWVNRTFQVGPGDRALFVTSPCFDLSVYDVFGVLGAGATVVVASDSQLSDPGEVGKLVDTAGITMWNSAPATLGAVLALSKGYPESPRLRLVMLSGDWIPLTLPDAIRERYRKARVVSLGGATEAAIWSNWYSVERIESDWASIPYGVPIQNCRYYVLDRQLRPAPIGVPGDLYIGGRCLAEGYLNRPELTRQRFIDDPFSASGTSRLYKSGDRATIHEDGQIRLLGRQDSQVKIRGVRVELGEIEAALLRIPGVKQSVAVTYTDSSGQKAVGAYVVPDKSATIEAQGIRDALAQMLMSFAVPSRITFLEALPLSQNGKVDRKALPAFEERVNASAYVAPRTPLERKLASLWEELLHVRPVGITDDFFTLGGHSLLAVTLMSQIRAKFGWDVPLERLIARPTIEALIAANASTTSESEPKHFLVFNPQGTKIPIVFVPGVYGTLFVFRRLPRHFGPDQPMYFAKDYTDTGACGEPNVEDMAAACEEELVKLCNRGPVILGGLSCGILVAFELAHRLARNGIEVPLLVSLDGMAPGYPEFLPRAQRILAHLREFVKGDRKQYLADRAANTRRRLLRLVGREHELHAEVQCATPEVRRMLKRTFYVNLRASKRYLPNLRYPGPLLLFRAECPERWMGIKGLDALNGWGSFVDGKISVVALPGNHSTILSDANQITVVHSIAEHAKNLTHRLGKFGER